MGTEKHQLNLLKAIVVCTIVISAVVPAYFIFRFYLLNEPISVPVVVLNVLFTVMVSIGISVANILTARYLQRKLPWDKHFAKRFIIEFTWASANATVVVVIIYSVFWTLWKDMYPVKETYSIGLLDTIAASNVINLVAMGISESVLFFKRWKVSFTEAEKFKRESVEARYAALKNQVNPHFLFNSLNTLSSLIRTSPDKAIDFVDKFSKIYRYVLDINDKVLIELREEINFLNSYFHLHKIRFGENIQLELKIDAEKLNAMVLPLSIQILLENAIKHNEVSSDRPLFIKIYTEDNFLVIQNTLQLKKNNSHSTGIGIKNLSERYSHLSDLLPEFYMSENYYIAKIPLIPSE